MKKTVILTHATTKENYLSIMENGFNPALSGEMVWNCSSDEEVYFYDVRKSDEHDGYMFTDEAYTKDEIDDMLNECLEDCIRRSFENAQIAAAVQNSQASELYCFVLEVPIDLIYDDYSCEGMADTASCVSVDDLSINMIKNIYKCDTLYSPSMRLFALSMVYGRDLLTDVELELHEIHAIKFLQISGYYNDDFSYDYEEIF